MAKRKNTRQPSKRKSNKNKSNMDIAIIGTIVLSILLAILLYTNSGELGKTLNQALGGMLGILRYVLPIGTFAIAIKMACKEEDEYITQKLVQYAILLICIAIIMSIYQISKGTIDVTGDISPILKRAYQLGANDIGGGVIGTLAAVPLVRLLGNLGAVVLSIGVSIMLFAFVFEIDISEIISEKVEEYIEKQEERAIEKENQKEERLKYAEEQKAKNMERKARQSKAIKENGKNAAGKEIHAIQELEEITKNEPEQIKIKLNGRVIDDAEEEKGFFSKLKSKKEKNKDNIRNSVTMTANSIGNINNYNDVAKENEAELFKQEEKQKQDKTQQVLQLEHTIAVEEENYVFPPIKILHKPEKPSLKGGTKSLTDTAAKLQKTLYSFGVSAKVENVTVGPAITRYELKPAEGVRVSKIANLADDIALNLAAETIRIEAPIPGKQAVGIEVPNKEKEMVGLREVLESEEFKSNDSKLSVALGKDVAGSAVVANIAKMPHVLIAGSTGSGKSVCINTIVTSIIYNSKPSEVKLIMVDPKVVELSVYNGIPHLLIPVVTDPKKAAGALAWAVQEMDDRYNKFAEKGVRDLKGYNKAVEEDGTAGKLPQIVIIVDELADLMMVAAKDVEEAICRLAQKARAARNALSYSNTKTICRCNNRFN